MKNLKKINLKENIIKDTDGITLISLVVTLIVIIIIATITISVSIDNEGVFTIMSQEKEKFEDKTAKQEGKIDELYTQIEYGANSEFISDYTRVEYIKSTGTQYIDTGVNPANTVDFEIDFKTEYNHRTQESADNNGAEVIFGYVNNNINKVTAFNFGAGVSERNMYLWKNNSYKNGARVIQLSTNTYNPVNRIKLESKNDVWKVNENTIDTADSVGEWRDTSATLIVFGFYNDGVINKFYDPFYLYNLKIWDNSKLIRDFIPCIRNSDSKPGLYDKINQTFYTNSGTGEFVTP